MNDQQSLFRSITAAPADDAPRLVYADWLDENGDAARAEFIRVQVALAREERHSPIWRKLDHRERKLFDYRWQKHMKGKALHCVFSRGFVDRITKFSKRLIDTADTLFELEPIQVVKLGNIAAQRGNVSIATLAQSMVLGRLSGLDLSLCTESPNLLWQLCTAKQLRNLRELTSCSVNITVDHLLTGLIAGEINQLETLAFDSSTSADYMGATRPDWDEASFKRLATWPGIKTLRSLALPDIPWTPALVTALASIPFKQLECLDFSGQHFSYSSAENETLGSKGLQILAESPHLATLKELHVPSQRIMLSGIQALAASPHMKNLRRLNLQANNLGQSGLATLLASPHITGLYFLNLDFCNITDVEQARAAVKKKYPEAVLRLA